MRNKDFSYYLTTYFSSYLPNHSGFSVNTIKSYRDTFLILIRYFNNELKIESKDITFDKFSKNVVGEFLLFLEEKQNNKTQTRNQRLACIHSFFKYVSNEELEFFDLCNDILKIKFKKSQIKTINYLTEENIKTLLLKPDTKLRQGRRDLAILILLYDTGMRVQEICDLKLENIKLHDKPTLTIMGKGNKVRIVPISKKTNDILDKYIKDYKITNNNEYLFRNKNNQKLSRWGIAYILNKYIDTNKISPHKLRHSKAMHLVEEGVNLIYIRDFLGHTSVTTTEIYARANPEIKRKYIEDISNKLLPNDQKFTDEQKSELEEWLRLNI